MKLLVVKKALPQIWILFALGVGGVQFFSLFFDYDPFFLERGLALIVAGFLMIFYSHTWSRFKISRARLPVILGLIFILLYLAVSSTISYLAPFFFFLFFLILIIQHEKLDGQIGPAQARFNRAVFQILIVILLLMYFSGNAEWFTQEERFIGFFSSPTTFATWLSAIFLMAYHQDFSGANTRVRLNALIAWALASFFVYSSGTRVNLAFMLVALFFLIFPSRTSSRLRGVVIGVGVAAVVFVYPIYTIIATYFTADLLAYRYSDGTDSSFGLRSVLFYTLLNSLNDTGLLGWALGNGAESSRVFIKDVWGVDLYPHNDAIRIVYDFGVFFAAGFMALIVYFGSRNNLAMLLTLLYVFSFMHNMVYSNYLIALVVSSSTLYCLQRRSLSG